MKSQTPSTKSQDFRCQVSEMMELNTETLVFVICDFNYAVELPGGDPSHSCCP